MLAESQAFWHKWLKLVGMLGLLVLSIWHVPSYAANEVTLLKTDAVTHKTASLHGNKSAAKQNSPDQAIKANLPLSLYLNAVSEQLEYDDAFNYRKLGKIANLPKARSYQHVNRNLVDRVVVYKSHYRMELLKDGKVVRKYWIALSDRPQGHKQYEGDRRTPEGVYTLDYVKERSYYYRAFHISYPNPQDIANARRMGKRPGGLIMVHGQPPSNDEYEASVQRTNWTNGCIAILNHEIDEFIELVDPGTPIEIKP